MRAPKQAPSESDRYLSPEETADLLGVHPRQLQQMRRRGDGPPFTPLGYKVIRYRWSVLQKWLDERTVANTSEAREKGVAAR